MNFINILVILLIRNNYLNNFYMQGVTIGRVKGT